MSERGMTITITMVTTIHEPSTIIISFLKTPPLSGAKNRHHPPNPGNPLHFLAQTPTLGGQKSPFHHPNIASIQHSEINTNFNPLQLSQTVSQIRVVNPKIHFPYPGGNPRILSQMQVVIGKRDP